MQSNRPRAGNAGALRRRGCNPAGRFKIMVETMAERAIAALIAFGSIIPLALLLVLLMTILSEFFKGVLYFVWAILKAIAWNVARIFENIRKY